MLCSAVPSSRILPFTPCAEVEYAPLRILLPQLQETLLHSLVPRRLRRRGHPMPPLWQQGSRAVLVRLQCHHVEEERLIIASAAFAPIPTLVSSRDWMREGGGHMVLRKNRVEIGNSGLLVFVANQEEEASVKNCAELAFSLPAVLLAISLT